MHVIDPTNPRRALDDGIEDRLHVGGRATDDAEHLGRCSLMFQGLTQFRVALLDLFEQSHVLSRDYGWGREGFAKRDLLFRERADFRAAEHDGAYGCSFAQ